MDKLTDWRHLTKSKDKSKATPRKSATDVAVDYTTRSEDDAPPSRTGIPQQEDEHGEHCDCDQCHEDWEDSADNLNYDYDPSFSPTKSTPNPMSRFRASLAALRVSDLIKYAISTRRRLVPQREFQQRAKLNSISCSVEDKPRAGVRDVEYILVFSDGVKWVVRIPANGPAFNNLNVRRMNSMYATMCLLRRKLKMPIPQVYAWETSSDAVGVPFALTAVVSGHNLSEAWDDPNWSTEEKRLLVIKNLAHTMAKMQRLRFDHTGMLYPNGNSRSLVLGSMIAQQVNFDSDLDSYDERTECGIDYLMSIGCQQSTTDWLFKTWEYEETSLSPTDIVATKIVRMAIESIPSYLQRQGCFTLGHPTLSFQDIFIDNDCNITAIINWNGVSVVPPGLGATCYPADLLKDWLYLEYLNPGSMGYNWRVGYPEPRNMLAKYRKHYADTFANLGLKDYDPRETRLSRILAGIERGTSSQLHRCAVAEYLLYQAFKGTLPWHPTYHRSINRLRKALTGNNSKLLEESCRKIREAFEAMWSAEWEDEREDKPEGDNPSDYRCI